MAQEFSPFGSHDFGIKENLADAIGTFEAFCQETAETQYGADLTELRAHIFQKMYEEDALNQGFGWAYFAYDGDLAGSSEGDLLTPPRKGVLMHVSISEEAEDETFEIPTIRIVTNEEIDMPDGSQELVATDFIADGEGECLYSVGVVGLESTDDAEDIDFDEDDEKNPWLPPIIVQRKAGEIGVRFFRPLPSFLSVPNTIQDQPIFPFGITKSLEDRRYALSQATEIFREVQDILPALKGAVL